MIHYGTSKQGKFIPDNRQAITVQLGTLEGKRVSVEVKKAVRKRSNPQNDYLWGVVYPIAKQGFRGIGEAMSVEEVHEFFKSRFHFKVISVKGHQVRVAKTTTTMTTEEFSDYVKKIRDFCLEWLGVFVPEPDPVGSHTAPLSV